MLYFQEFVIHALPEAEFDRFLADQLPSQNFTCTLSNSTTGVTNNEKAETFFKSSIGAEHFRMLYSEAYLDGKLGSYFNILHAEESNKFSVFQEKALT